MKRPIRTLHIVGSMSRGGVETWLMHLVRAADRARLQFDFLMHTDQPCAYDTEALGYGCRLLRCPHLSRPWHYGNEFTRLLKQNGPYDVVHSHVHHFSGMVLRLARRAGVPLRVAHSHLDTRSEDARSGLPRRLYLSLMRHLVGRHANGRLAASREAGLALFGAASDRRPWQVIYCGVDLSPFDELPDRDVVRQESGLPPHALVLGHVGRFMEQKNHSFLVDIAGEVFRRDPEARLVMIGEGVLREAIEKKVQAAGHQDRVLFRGSRPDVPRMLSSLDVFVLPSLFEGLPLVGMEAQAAGLPLVLTDTITSEVDIVPGLVHRVGLDQPASVWAERILTAARKRPDRAEALERVRRSPFNIQQGVLALEHYYANALGRA